MPIPNTLSRKITADFRAEKKYGGRKKFCDALSAHIRKWTNINRMTLILISNSILISVLVDASNIKWIYQNHLEF